MSTTSQRPSAYQPTGDDHLIFEFVKMQGKTQSEVAGMFGINQSTISRIIQRYERWQAHAKARENGRLSPEERLRAQRWLTYERNELILASCLRIAQEMEGFTEVAKSTIHRPWRDPSKETEVRTQHASIDRSGVAARFLRLAFRVNMEQLKLVALIEPPAAEPLTDEELAAEAHQAALDTAEIAAARQKARAENQWLRKTEEQDAEAPAEPDSSLPGSPLVTPEPEGPPSSTDVQLANPPTHHSPTHDSPLPLHNLHNENAKVIAATAISACTCTPNSMAEKKPSCSCIINLTPDRSIELIQLQTPQSLPKLAPTAAHSPSAAAT